MSLYGFFLLGSYLMLVTQIDSYVLLTANMEDIKRIARSFIPAALVDNIAELISKASVSIAGAGISKENENFYKIKAARGREPKTEDIKDPEGSEVSEFDGNDEVRTKTSDHIDSVQVISNEKLHYKDSRQTNDKKREKTLKYQSKSSTYSYPKKVKSKKVYHQKYIKKKKTLYKKEINETENKNDGSKMYEEPEYIGLKTLTTGLDSDQTSSGEKVKVVFNNLDRYDETSQENNVNVKAKISELVKSKKKTTNNKSSVVKVKPKDKYSKLKDKSKLKNKYSDKVDRSVTLSTRIERNEFDQYDNHKYPKSEILVAATSGNLELTMLVDSRINSDGSE